MAAGLAVGALAIAFAEATGKSPNAVLFSGEEAFGSLFGSEPKLALSTLALLILFKGLAWSVSLGNFRGGPTFPAIFLGVVAGLMAAHLPGYAESGRGRSWRCRTRRVGPLTSRVVPSGEPLGTISTSSRGIGRLTLREGIPLLESGSIPLELCREPLYLYIAPL